MQIDSDDKVKFEIFWKAPYVYGDGWHASRVDLTLGQSTCEVYAPINQELSSQKEQVLNFVLYNKELHQKKRCEKVEVPFYMIKSMQISVKFFQSCQNNKSQIELPVSLDPFYDFQPKETYQIRIVCRDNILKAIIDKKIFEATRKKKLRSSKFMSIKRDKIPSSSTKFNHVLREFKKMVKALTTDNSELDQLSTEKLKLLFNERQEKLEKVKINFKVSLKTSPLKDPPELQRISTMLISVVRALNKKGIFF